MVNKHDKDKYEDEVEITNEAHDSFDPVDPELEDIEEYSKDAIKKIRSELKVAQEEKRLAQESLQRERADFLNARKRQEEQLQRDRGRITLAHVEELLPLADSFEMAMRDERWGSADVVWRKGVEGIYAQLQAIFRSYNVTEIDPKGESFNPHEHEALIDNGGEHKVSAVIQKGYKCGDMVIRPAKVAVG